MIQSRPAQMGGPQYPGISGRSHDRMTQCLVNKHLSAPGPDNWADDVEPNFGPNSVKDKRNTRSRAWQGRGRGGGGARVSAEPTHTPIVPKAQSDDLKNEPM